MQEALCRKEVAPDMESLRTASMWVFLRKRKTLGVPGLYIAQFEDSSFNSNNILHIPLHLEYQKLESAFWNCWEKAYFIYNFRKALSVNFTWHYVFVLYFYFSFCQLVILHITNISFFENCLYTLLI